MRDLTLFEVWMRGWWEEWEDRRERALGLVCKFKFNINKTYKLFLKELDWSQISLGSAIVFS